MAVATTEGKRKDVSSKFKTYLKKKRINALNVAHTLLEADKHYIKVARRWC